MFERTYVLSFVLSYGRGCWGGVQVGGERGSHVRRNGSRQEPGGDQADLKKLKAQFKQAKMAALKGRCSMTGWTGAFLDNPLPSDVEA
eukprot:526778-Amphidinium_carterae.1